MRRIVVGCLCLLVGFGAGWALRPAPAPSECASAEPSAVVARADNPTRRMPAAGAPEAIGDVPPVEYADGFGDGPALGDSPAPWPQGLPVDLQPETVQRDLEALGKECDPESFLRVDCSEPPCLLAFLDPGEENWQGPGPWSCPQWSKKYGDSVSMMNAKMLCADGAVRRITLTGPYLEEFAVPTDPSDPDVGSRRMNTRMAALRASIGCSAPATLQVENRLGYRLEWTPENAAKP